MFDLRSLEHSSIVYEDTGPLLRFAWNRVDSNYLAVRISGGWAEIGLLSFPGVN